MIKKNVYFLYPAGYAGNYLQWTINVSDVDKRKTTTVDPILPDATTHGFVRRPTHQSIIKTLVWNLYNRPQSPQTYIVNCHDTDTWLSRAAYAANLLLRSDPECILVNIHASGDDVRYGALNTYLKWPVYFAASSHNYDQEWADFDFFAGQQNRCSLTDRNWLYHNWQSCFPTNSEFNYNELKHNLDRDLEWFHQRNTYSPHEVTQDQYLLYPEVPKDRIVDINLRDIMTENFISWWCQIIDDLDIGDFDFSHAISYHSKYVSAQAPLQWYDSIHKLRTVRQVDPWLLSNDLCQAFVLHEMNLSGTDWETTDTASICRNLGYSVSSAK